jgi:hypothetical protein
LFIFSSAGTTTVRSWRMMEDETYGMIPRAKIESCSNAPPEKKLRRPRRFPDCTTRFMTKRSTPGVVT